MKFSIKAILIACLLLSLTLFAVGCGKVQTPYQTNDGENYTVSVKFDAGEGTFTTNTPVIVDSYNVQDMKTNAEGKVQLALIEPENPQRGKNAFTAVYNGYFLAGWYTERTENGTDAAGNPSYTYGGKWDFAQDRLEVDPTAQHTASEPVLTLYAAWVPLFEVEFYALDSGEALGSYSFNPTTDNQLSVPVLDEETGAYEMYHFPNRNGYTYKGAYYDEAATQAVDTEKLTHPGSVDMATAQAKDPVLKVYVDWIQGEWYHIYNTDQFLDNASVNGSYVIHADLDFTDKIWPSALMHGTFNGTIEGNGHSFSNITMEQTNNSKTATGLFGGLSETAVIKDLALQNVTLTIKKGTRMAGSSFGLLAGTVSESTVLSGVTIADSALQIDAAAYFGTDDYVIGLVCGMGSTDIDHSAITCTAVGDNPEAIVITVTDGTVTVAPAAT